MGKIIRAGNVGGSYVVGVPKAVVPLDLPATNGRLDDAFAEPFSPAFDAAGAFDAPLPVAEPSIDWEQLRSDAERIVDGAASDAERIVDQAQGAALEIVAKAQAEAASIREEAASGGKAEGYAEGKAQAESEMSVLVQTMYELLDGIRAQREAVIAGAEPEVVRLAMAVAERIVHAQVAQNDHAIVDNVRHALTRLAARETVTLRVNPADLETIRHYREAILSSSDIEQLRIVEDQRVDRGGTVVETESGTIDAKISTQLREARKAILKDDAIALDPSYVEEELLSPPAAAS